MNVGRKIKEVIDWSPYTQKEIAEAIDVSPSMLSSYISDTYQISLDRLERLSAFLDVSVWTFLNGEDLPATPLDLTEREGRLVAEFRRLDPAEQDALYQFLKTIKR